MDTGSTIVGIAILIVISIFIIAVIVGFYLSDQPSNNAAIQTTSGNFLSACTTTPCSDGLICDPSSFICKLGTGALCSDFSDCATGLICSGICTTGPTGGLNQLCPCDQGFICTGQVTGPTICKGASGTTCQSGIDCASGDCLSNGTCARGSPNSFPCSSNIQCASLNCNNGFCQNPGIITGTLGAACEGTCVSFGNVVGAGCSGSIQQPLTCQCSMGTGAPGICGTANQGILSPCSLSRACSDELICYNPSAIMCGSGDTGCLCTFTYTDPNVVTAGVECIGGMSKRPGSSTCFNANGLGCDVGGLCANSSCGGSSVLGVYQFSRISIPNLGPDFLGATTTSILAGTSGPSGLIQPHKLFATSNQNVDVIYLVDNLQGFWFLQYNPITKTILTPWMQIIPHTTTTGNTTRTLIDVGYNGTNFLVAFNETVAGVGQNDTVYIGTSPLALTPFNVQPGSGITGTQYTITGTPLSIEYIDISPANDVSPGNDALISINGTIYVKQSTQTSYSIGVIQGGPMNGTAMTGLTGPAYFYFDNTANRSATGPPMCPATSPNNPVQCPSYNNIAFVGPFDGIYDQVLQFSGNIAGVADPTDRLTVATEVQYRVFDYSIYSPKGTGPTAGMPNSSYVMLTEAYQGSNFIDNIVNVSQGGTTTPIPYRISTTSRSVVTRNAVYVLSIASCD